MNDLGETHRLIGAINETIKKNPIPNFPDAEIWGDLERIPEFKQLVGLSAGNWQAALRNLQGVAPDRQSRIVLFHSFAELAPEDYLKCSNQLLDLVVSKQINKDEFLYTVLMSPNQKKWFWSYNHNAPGVVQFLNRVKGVFSTDKNIPKLADFILSGEAKKRDEFLRKENAYYGNQPLPLLNTASPKSTGSATQQPAHLYTAPVAQNVAMPASQASTIAKPSSNLPFGWILAGTIVIIVGGLFAWKKLS